MIYPLPNAESSKGEHTADYFANSGNRYVSLNLICQTVEDEPDRCFLGVLEHKGRENC